MPSAQRLCNSENLYSGESVFTLSLSVLDQLKAFFEVEKVFFEELT